MIGLVSVVVHERDRRSKVIRKFFDRFRRVRPSDRLLRFPLRDSEGTDVVDARARRRGSPDRIVLAASQGNKSARIQRRDQSETVDLRAVGVRRSQLLVEVSE